MFEGGSVFWETEFRPSQLLPLFSRKLSHPKLVQLYGVCLEQAPICLVFEFMEHGCLSDYLRSQRGLFAAETLLGMCLDVCEGMAYLEEKCVIHRDLVRGCRAKPYKSRVKGHVPLKCRTTKTGNARINKKAQAFFLPVATSSFLHPRGRSSWDSVLGSIPSPTSNCHSLSWSLHSSKMKLTAAPP